MRFWVRIVVKTTSIILTVVSVILLIVYGCSYHEDKMPYILVGLFVVVVVYSIGFMVYDYEKDMEDK